MAARIMRYSKYTFCLHNYISIVCQSSTFFTLCYFQLLDGMGAKPRRFLRSSGSSGLDHVRVLPVHLHPVEAPP